MDIPVLKQYLAKRGCTDLEVVRAIGANILVVFLTYNKSRDTYIIAISEKAITVALVVDEIPR